jgi:hypothetical protein
MKVSVEIFKWRLGDGTNNGLTANANQVYLIDDLKELETIPATAEVLIIKNKRSPWNREEVYKYAEPIERPAPGCNGWMMGGNFVYTPDSRFREFFNLYPIPVHDRQEKVNGF